MSLNIGFDAKRAFLNSTGLGNYSRTLLDSLARYAPEHRYSAYTPRTSELYNGPVPAITPHGVLNKKLSALWRSRGIVPQLKSDKIDLYHGLSNEIPHGLAQADIPSIVTIHDLIFMQEPEGYKAIDRYVFRKKVLHSIEYSDHIVAISQQTQQEVANFTSVRPEKISVIYQSCDPVFRRKTSVEERVKVRSAYNLPESYILHVGGWNPRKNLDKLVDAIAMLPTTLRPALVALGAEPRPVKGDVYVRFLQNVPQSQVPTLYQMATLVAYPSLLEGFGLPVLEAMTSGVPVLTSPGGCMEEVGADAAIYADPRSTEAISDGLRQLLFDSSLRDTCITAGRVRAAWFSPERIAREWAALYEEVAGKQ
ncbi:MAG: glycosyltransferase family 4 protein [Bacteroidia bacterium]